VRDDLCFSHHVEIIRGYKRGYGESFERRRYARLHGVRHKLLE
jgi:hypothetical protein